MLQKLRFTSSIGITYILTIGAIAVLLQSSHLFGGSVQADMPARWHRDVTEGPSVISGKPNGITINGTGISLPVTDGQYDASSLNWTLSDDHAQFAVMSSLANDRQGTTFIYGHGTDAVFGKIGEKHPAMGTMAELKTDSGHTFTYKLVDIHDYTPNDTSILNDTYSGAPRLVVQTCTGALSQWRTMFIFEYVSVT